MIQLTADNCLHLTENRSTMLWVSVDRTFVLNQRFTIDGRLLEVIGMGSVAQQKNGKYRITVKQVSSHCDEQPLVLNGACS